MLRKILGWFLVAFSFFLIILVVSAGLFYSSELFALFPETFWGVVLSVTAILFTCLLILIPLVIGATITTS